MIRYGTFFLGFMEIQYDLAEPSKPSKNTVQSSKTR